jgi:hypothetical protein
MTRITLNRRGRNRWTLLLGNFAIKFPSPRSWQDFLFGILNNMKEAADGHLPGRCPVLARSPLGLVIVMRRAEPLSDDEFASFDAYSFCREHGVRAECKPDSFGRLGDRIVALDYGW